MDSTGEIDARMLEDIVRRQEKLLEFQSFSNADALEIGCLLARMARSSERPVAIRVYLDGCIVFQYTMQGKEESHFSWTQRKYETVVATGMSTMRLRVRVKCMGDVLLEADESKRLTVGSGGFPVRVGGELRGAICVSGLRDPMDHVLVVQALSCLQGISVPQMPGIVEAGWLPLPK